MNRNFSFSAVFESQSKKIAKWVDFLAVMEWYDTNREAIQKILGTETLVSREVIEEQTRGLIQHVINTQIGGRSSRGDRSQIGGFFGFEPLEKFILHDIFHNLYHVEDKHFEASLTALEYTSSQIIEEIETLAIEENFGKYVGVRTVSPDFINQNIDNLISYFCATLFFEQPETIVEAISTGKFILKIYENEDGGEPVLVGEEDVTDSPLGKLVDLFKQVPQDPTHEGGDKIETIEDIQSYLAHLYAVGYVIDNNGGDRAQFDGQGMSGWSGDFSEEDLTEVIGFELDSEEHHRAYANENGYEIADGSYLIDEYPFLDDEINGNSEYFYRVEDSDLLDIWKEKYRQKDEDEDEDDSEEEEELDPWQDGLIIEKIDSLDYELRSFYREARKDAYDKAREISNERINDLYSKGIERFDGTKEEFLRYNDSLAILRRRFRAKYLVRNDTRTNQRNEDLEKFSEEEKQKKLKKPTRRMGLFGQDMPELTPIEIKDSSSPSGLRLDSASLGKNPATTRGRKLAGLLLHLRGWLIKNASRLKVAHKNLVKSESNSPGSLNMNDKTLNKLMYYLESVGKYDKIRSSTLFRLGELLKDFVPYYEWLKDQNNRRTTTGYITGGKMIDIADKIEQLGVLKDPRNKKLFNYISGFKDEESFAEKVGEAFTIKYKKSVPVPSLKEENDIFKKYVVSSGKYEEIPTPERFKETGYKIYVRGFAQVMIHDTHPVIMDRGGLISLLGSDTADLLREKLLKYIYLTYEGFAKDLKEIAPLISFSDYTMGELMELKSSNEMFNILQGEYKIDMNDEQLASQIVTFNGNGYDSSYAFLFNRDKLDKHIYENIIENPFVDFSTLMDLVGDLD